MNHEVEITICRELLGLYNPKQAETKTISVPRVNFRDFDELQHDGRRLIQSFADRSRDRAACRPEDSFEPFIFGWIALNSWASCVTGSEEERAYLKALMLDIELNRRFDSLLEATDFQTVLGHFRELWPILRPLPQARIPAASASRQERILQVLNDPRRDSRFRPGCASRHYKAGERIPMDWAHALSAIYQVRCNLFHGSKSLHSDVDTQIVFNSFRVLVHVLPMLGL
jgi:hypothetical protein